VGDLLVLWDVDYTLVSADGLGTRLYEVVFREMFGRELTTVAPKAGRTDRAIITDTLALAGIPEPQAQVDRFLAVLASQVAAVDGSVNGWVRPLAGASAAIAALAEASTSHRQIHQSVLTGNMRPLAVLKLGLADLSDHLDLGAGAYGDAHEVRAELVPLARLAASRGTTPTPEASTSPLPRHASAAATMSSSASVNCALILKTPAAAERPGARRHPRARGIRPRTVQ